MFAVYLTSSGSSDWLGIVVALAVAGGLSAFLSARVRTLVLVLLVAALLAYASMASAQPYPLPCDPVWRWMGWC